MVKCFSKKYGNGEELSTLCNPKVMSRCLSAPDTASLPHCLQKFRGGHLVTNKPTVALKCFIFGSEEAP